MLQKVRPNEHTLTFALIWGMVMLVGLAIGQANLVREINMQTILLISATLGVIAGTALARSNFPALTALIYALVYGLFVMTWLVGRTYPATTVWRDRVADMVIRQAEWINAAVSGGQGRDALIFVMHTTLVMWFLGYLAAWWTFRVRQIWAVILPSGLVLLSVIYFASPVLAWFLALYSLLALIYIAHTHLLDNRQIWRRYYVRHSRSVTGLFLRSSLIVALFVLAAVWRAPALPVNAAVSDAVTRVNEPWRIVRDNWQRLFSTLNAPTRMTSDPFLATLDMGGPRNPSDAVVMDIYVDQPLPYAYWRSAVLDRYDNGEWRVEEGSALTVLPDQPPPNVPRDQRRVLVTQRIVNFLPNAGTIYAAPDLLQSDREMIVRTQYNAQGQALFSAARARFVLQLGDTYEVTSLFSMADQTQLRDAGVVYPPHVRERYLDVPATITPRTRELAAQFGARYDNPYDMAVAVQNYLRVNIRYNDQVDAPPAGVEPLDFLLFESREGYCNYYASAMAMLLRLNGVPARVARGYAAGDFDPVNNRYRVLARDAHAWPEVFFPGYGWIQFEPTVVIDPFNRPLGEGPAGPPAAEVTEMSPEELQAEFGNEPENATQDPPEELSPDDIQAQPPLPGSTTATGLQLPAFLANLNPWRVLSALGVLVVGGALIVVAERMNRRVEGTIDGSYGRLALWAGWLGVNLRPNHTPHERADLLAQAVPDGERPIRRLIEAFVRERFTRSKQVGSRFSPLQEWRELRPLLLRRLFDRVRRRRRAQGGKSQ